MKRHDDSVVIVQLIHLPSEHELLGIIHAHNALSLALGLCQGGQEHAGQNRDDGDNHQQFDQGKAFLALLESDRSDEPDQEG